MEKSEYFVKPVEINLNEKVFHYVPILDSLKVLMLNQNFKNEYFENSRKLRNPQLIDSFFSCNNFRNNNLFTQNNAYIQIKLFIDGFDTTNPLGDKRKMSNLIGVYYKVGNLPNYLQSSNYTTQLAMLFDKTFIKDSSSYDKIFENLIKDIQTLF